MKHSGRARPATVLAALGVGGGIGTRPLYALRECFLNVHHPLPVTTANVLGVLALITWALLIVVSIEFMALLLRADNDGEGRAARFFCLPPNRVVELGAQQEL